MRTTLVANHKCLPCAAIHKRNRQQVVLLIFALLAKLMCHMQCNKPGVARKHMLQSAIRSNVVHCHKHHVAYGNQAFNASTACALADTGRLAAGLPFNHRLPVLQPDLHCKLQFKNHQSRSTREPFTMQHCIPCSPIISIFVAYMS